MVQIPHEFFVKRSARLGFRLPEPGSYAVGFIFMPQDAELRRKMEQVVNKVIEDEGQVVLGWRDVPVRQFLACRKAPEIVATEPCHRQVIIGRGDGIADEDAFERKLYIIRKVMLGQDLFGLRGQAERLLHRLDELPHAGLQGHVPRRPARRLLPGPARSATSSRRSRSSTSASRPTPSRPGGWRTPTGSSATTARSTPCAATSTGWRRGRRRCRRRCSAPTLQKLWPISYAGQSDTACFDNALEFLIRGGYSLPHAAMMLIPEAWAGNPLMDEEPQAFYEYHAALMEPWDGPAAMCFSDGRPHRRDARPQRPASGPLLRHRRRRGHHGLRGRRAADPAREDRDASGACSRARCCSST